MNSLGVALIADPREWTHVPETIRSSDKSMDVCAQTPPDIIWLALETLDIYCPGGWSFSLDPTYGEV